MRAIRPALALPYRVLSKLHSSGAVPTKRLICEPRSFQRHADHRTGRKLRQVIIHYPLILLRSKTF